jgi:heme/copper-type cytochrome/quinol oxidase subunit 1
VKREEYRMTEQVQQTVGMSTEDPLTPYTRKWSRRFLYFSFLNFIIAGTLALFMRTDQAGAPLTIGPLGTPQVFGQLLTAHGLGMFIGWQFPFTYGLIAYIFPKYMKRKLYNERLLPVVFFLFFAGFYIVWIAITLGFGPGWYFLFPLPFHSGPSGAPLPWGLTEAAIFFGGMLITNLSLLVFTYLVFGTAFSSKYQDDYNLKPGINHSMSAKFAASIGFDAYMPAAVRARIMSYPPAAIASMVTTLAMIVSAPPFLTLLSDGFFESLNNTSFLNNLVAKNFLWINYHPIVYYAFFPLIGMYYTLLPIFANKHFDERWVRIPWPILLITGVGVYSHHLFIDTSQPFALQIMSESMSMAISVGSGISVFTLFALLWRSKYQWNLTGKFLIASIFGWVVGGVMGTEQGNIPTDVYLHNTYAVVSHFHLNGLDGIVMAGFGVLYFILPEISGKQWYSKSLGEIHFWGTVVGGFGMALIFGVMGYLGVARRQYAPVQTGLPFTITLDYQFWLYLAFMFAIILATAQIPFIWNILKTLTGPTITKPEVLPTEAQIAIPVPTPMSHSVQAATESKIKSGQGGGAVPPGLGVASQVNSAKSKDG